MPQKKNSSKDLEGTQLDLLQCIVWAIATWNELEQEIIHNAWRVPNILPHNIGMQPFKIFLIESNHE